MGNSYGFLTVYNLPLIVPGDSSYMEHLMDRMFRLFHLVVEILEILVVEPHKDILVEDRLEQMSKANVNPLVYQHRVLMVYPKTRLSWVQLAP